MLIKKNVFFLNIVALLIATASVAFSSQYLILFASVIVIIAMLSTIREDYASNMILGFYLLSFIVFMLSIPLMNIGSKELIPGATEKGCFTTLMCIFLALFFIQVGFEIGNQNKNEENSSFQIEDYTQLSSLNAVASISFIGTVLTFPFMFIVKYEKISVASMMSYVDLYQMKSSYPFFIQKLAVFYIIFAFIFLSTFSTKKKTNFVIFTYIVYLVMDLLTGRRGVFLTGLLTLITYLAIRRKIFSEEHGHRKVFIIGMVIIGIGLTLLMGMVGVVRQKGTAYWGYGIKETLQQLGSTINVVSYSVENSSKVRGMNNSYTWYSLIESNSLFHYIYSKLTTNPNYGSSLQYMNNLGNTETFFRDPIYFRMGGSFGTSYIAELYIDYAYLGICIYNFFLGFAIAKLQKVRVVNWVGNTYLLLILSHLYFMPRESALDPWVQIISISTFIIVFIVYYLAQLISSRSVVMAD